MSPTPEIDTRLMAQLREDLLDSLDEEFELEMEDRLGEDAARSAEPISTRIHYFRELLRLQTELVKLQDWVVATGHKVVIIFDLGTVGDGSANFTYHFDDIRFN